MHLDITLKPGVWIDPAKFIKQIADAGYAARKDDIRLALIGKATKEGDKILFALEDAGQDAPKFMLLKGESKNEKEAKAWKEAYEKASAKAGELIAIEAFWKPADVKKDKDALPTLALIRVSEAKFEAPSKKR